MRVYNISSRSLVVSGGLVRPGDVVDIPATAKHLKLLGTYLSETAPVPVESVVVTSPMTREEASAWLDAQPDSTIVELAGELEPPLALHPAMRRPVHQQRLLRAIFSPNYRTTRVAFRWLRRPLA